MIRQSSIPGSAGTRRYSFQVSTHRHSRQTDRPTDGRTTLSSL